MKQKLAAPLAVFISTLIAFSRLAVYGQDVIIEGVGRLGTRTILAYLFFDAGTLEPTIAMHMMFLTASTWLVAFSVLWLLFVLISKDARR